MSELIRTERRGGASWVILNRPQALNALSKQLNLELRELANQLAQDRDVRVVVITGAGEKSFCAGADLKERKGVTADETAPYVNAIGGAIDSIADLPMPTIAAINGYALGGGMELALACDFRIASSNAKFALTEVRLGIMPGAGGTQRLPRLIGVAAAKQLIMLGRRIDAQRALELGLVMQVVEPADLVAAVDAVVDELSGCAPISVAKAKQAIDRGIAMTMADGLRFERTCYDVTLFTDDRDEGLRAFAEKRKPEYKGR